MAALTKDAINLRESLTEASAAGPALSLRHQQVTEADGTETEFPVRKGCRAFAVFNAGLLQTEGSAEEYTQVFDGFTWKVKFAVAPGLGNSVAVWPYEVSK